MAFPTPGRVALGLPSPSPRVCTDGRTDGRTLTSQPKFFASIHYQISLAMELRWRALPAGSAINKKEPHVAFRSVSSGPYIPFIRRHTVILVENSYMPKRFTIARSKFYSYRYRLVISRQIAPFDCWQYKTNRDSQKLLL